MRMTSCPEEKVLRIWRFWKDGIWILSVERCSWILIVDDESWDSAIERCSWVCNRWDENWGFDLWGMRLSFSGLDWQRWIEILNITLWWGQHSMVSMDLAWIRIVPLSSCYHRPNPEINKPVRIGNNRIGLCLSMYCIGVVTEIITAVVYDNISESEILVIESWQHPSPWNKFDTTTNIKTIWQCWHYKLTGNTKIFCILTWLLNFPWLGLEW